MPTPKSSHLVDPLLARVTSPWTIRQRVLRFVWYWVEGSIFRFSPRPFYRWRNLLLRLFGAGVDRSCRIRPTVKIEIPWNLTVGAQTIIGDDVLLYCLGPVTIGQRVTISQLGHLCAGTHDCTRRDFPLQRPPIEIGDDVWLAADVFVGPGVRIGAGAVVGARSSVFHDLPSWQICVGTPAKAIKERKMVDVECRSRL
jgi:putative colanic acid biosynthesis acetyltransferase WcaF